MTHKNSHHFVSDRNIYNVNVDGHAVIAHSNCTLNEGQCSAICIFCNLRKIERICTQISWTHFSEFPECRMLRSAYWKALDDMGSSNTSPLEAADILNLDLPISNLSLSKTNK